MPLVNLSKPKKSTKTCKNKTLTVQLSKFKKQVEKIVSTTYLKVIKNNAHSMTKDLQTIIDESANFLRTNATENELRIELIKHGLRRVEIDIVVKNAEEKAKQLNEAYIPELPLTKTSLAHAIYEYNGESADEAFKERDLRNDGNFYITPRESLERGTMPEIFHSYVDQPLELGAVEDYLKPNLALFPDREEKQRIYIDVINSPNASLNKMTPEINPELVAKAEEFLRSGKTDAQVRRTLRSKRYAELIDDINSAIQQARANINSSRTTDINPVDPVGIKTVVPIEIESIVVAIPVADPSPSEEIPTIVEEEFFKSADSDLVTVSPLVSSSVITPVTPTTLSHQRKSSDFFPKLGLAAIAGIGILTAGNLLWPYLENIYKSLTTEQLAVQEIVPEVAPIATSKRETLEEKIDSPRVVEATPIIPLKKEEAKIISYDGKTVTINPLSSYGLTSYAALFTEKEPAELSLLSFEEQKTLLREKRTSLATASKADLREILAITTNIAQANPKDVYKEDLTLEGIKDSTRNVIYAGVPLEFPLEETIAHAPKKEERTITKALGKEELATRLGFEAVLPIKRKEDEEESEKILIYNVRDQNDPLDDKISVRFTLPGAGLSQYATVLVEQGWNRENLYELAQLAPSEQVARVREANTSHIRTLDADDLASILEITREIIQNPLNSSEVYHVDLSEQGIKYGENNIVYFDNFLLVSPPSENAKPFIPEDAQTSLDAIITNNFTNEELPKLNQLVRDYFELQQIVRDIPFLADERLMAELVGNIAQQYNFNPPANTPIDPLVTREERIVLAQDLYQRTIDRRDRELYMTETEILDFVSEGLAERINSNNLQTGVIFEETIPNSYPHPERKQRPMKVSSPKIITALRDMPSSEVNFIPQTLTDPRLDEFIEVKVRVFENEGPKQITITPGPLTLGITTIPTSPEYSVPVQRVNIVEDDRITKHTLIPSQVQAYMNIWEMLLDNPGANTNEAKAVLQPLALKISEDYGDRKIEKLNLNPLPKSVRLALATDLQNLGDNYFVPTGRIFEIVNAGFTQTQAGYISSSDLATAMMAPSPYAITMREETTNDAMLPDLETILRQTDQSYEKIQEPKRAQEMYFTARNLEEKNVLIGHDVSEKLLTQLVTQYKEGKDIGVKGLNTEQRVTLAAQLYSSPDFADKRFASYITTKDIEEMLNPEVIEYELSPSKDIPKNVEYISIRDMREAGKESFGRTRKDAQTIARDLRREEVYSLYLVIKQNDEDLTPYAFSQMKEMQEYLHMKPATIKRDIDWNVGLEEGR